MRQAAEIALDVPISKLDLPEFEMVLMDLMDLYYDQLSLSDQENLKLFIESFISEKLDLLLYSKSRIKFENLIFRIEKTYDIDFKLRNLTQLKTESEDMNGLQALSDDLDRSQIELSDTKVLLKEQASSLQREVSVSQQNESKLQDSLTQTKTTISDLKNQTQQLNEDL